MSIIGVVLNLLLAGLLGAALAMGWKLNGRLKGLRDSQDGFGRAVRELNLAAERAEQGLADLRAATDHATDELADRIEKGRALAARLERLVQQRPERPERAEEAVLDGAAERRLGALLAAARESRGRPGRADRDEPLELREPVVLRRRPMDEEDDLFAEPMARAPLSAIAGGRR